MRSNKKPKILEIVGDSGSGKSEFSKGIVNLLKQEQRIIICTDDYHIYNRKQRQKLNITALHPRATNLDLLECHLKELYTGKVIHKPCYDHATGDFTSPEHILPRPFIITEGLLFSMRKKKNRNVTLRVYLDTEEQLKLKWKINRDLAKRGYNKQDILTELERRKSDFATYIQPQKNQTDINITFFSKTPDDKNISFRFGLWNKRHDIKLNKIFHPISLKEEEIEGKKMHHIEVDGVTPPEKLARINNSLIRLLSTLEKTELNLEKNYLQNVLTNHILTAQLLLMYYWLEV